LYRGSPVKHVLHSLQQTDERRIETGYEYISGIYADGMPYNGAITRINFRKRRWEFAAVSTPDKPKTVLQFVKAHHKNTGIQPQLAWNGGYILNPELVGKLGLPEAYIGSPLGMLISEGNMISPPLYNKPAILFHKNGNVTIRKVNCMEGLTVIWNNQRWRLDGSARNPENQPGDISYYDLLYPGEEIEGNGRVFVRLAGNRVKEILSFSQEHEIDLIVLNSHKIDFKDPSQGWGTISYKVGILSRCPVMLVK